MGRFLLVVRLAARDLRRRRLEAVLLLMAMTAATTTLALGLVVQGVASDPYQRTREATAGPDVVAAVSPSFPLPGDASGPSSTQPADLASLESLAEAPGVVGHSGPYPVIGASLEASGQTSDVQVLGRDPEPASVDHPELTQGSWVRDGGVVVEAAFADAIGVSPGDQVTLNGRSFDVVGVAITAAQAPYPEVSCYLPCLIGTVPDESVAIERPPGLLENPGLVWLTQADARSVAPEDELLTYILNLKLVDPGASEAFVEAHEPDSYVDPRAETWQHIFEQASNQVRRAQEVLKVGAGLLGSVAAASVAVLVGGRMADQTRRVGLLKAVGGTPRLVAAVLLAEYVVVALIAAGIGLGLSVFVAPALIEPSLGLLGSAGAPSLTLFTVGFVTSVALGVAAVATFIPAVRAARTSTVLALADSARPPRRSTLLIAISARLPTSLLLALRVAARRPRHMILAMVSVAITVSGIVAALSANAQVNEQVAASGIEASQDQRLFQVLLMIMAMLCTLAAVNAVFTTWATVLDARHDSALARALGATPAQVSAGLSFAQLVPAVAGALLGIPGGIGLLAVIAETPRVPPLWQLLVVIPVTVIVVVVLTAIPARSGGRRPVAETLRGELA